MFCVISQFCEAFSVISEESQQTRLSGQKLHPNGLLANREAINDLEDCQRKVLHCTGGQPSFLSLLQTEISSVETHILP